MKTEAVESRMQAPTAEVDESPQRLYRQVAQQLTPETIPWTISYRYITPEDAQRILDAADENPDFRQRKRTPARIARWSDLMQTGRYVDFLPDGPLCFNDKGYLLNGGNRLKAITELDDNARIGFIVIEKCPQWMFQYFDQGNSRSSREQMFMNNRDVNMFTQGTVRLGMRYEEFLFGKRSPSGWVYWGRVKDENTDLDNWMDRREYVTDCVEQGKAITKKTMLQTPSGACFVAYQQLAWPEGIDDLQDYLDGLISGSMLRKGNPALTLREWGKSDGYIGAASAGRREGHLLLLFKMFQAFQNKSTVDKILVAKGFPMHMPYHPKGFEVAVANVREALDKMDAENE
jgi:hypothetical protein